MERLITKNLLEWKSRPTRKPLISQGPLAEQFVGQELVAAAQSDLYYWAREAKSSSAEVDYLIVTCHSAKP